MSQQIGNFPSIAHTMAQSILNISGTERVQRGSHVLEALRQTIQGEGEGVESGREGESGTEVAESVQLLTRESTMQRRTCLALVGAVSVLTAAARLPRGVGPEFASHYSSSSDDFACIGDPSVKLALSRINDNSCDCADGSDEPGTAACAFIDALSPEQPLGSGRSTNTSRALPGFWCENKGHVGGYVPFQYVNDGVCDYELCCDGSEEFGGRLACEDRCAEIGREHRRKVEERMAGMKRALKKREAMVSEAARLRRQAESRLAQLTADVERLEARREEAKRKQAEVELADRSRVVSGGGGGGKLGVLAGLARKRVDELRGALEGVRREGAVLRGQVDELRGIMSSLKAGYNPNFNDEGVKAAVKAFEDFSAREGEGVPEQVLDADVDELLREDGAESGINWGEFEDQAEDTDILLNLEAYLPESLRKAIRNWSLDLRLWLVRNGILADRPRTGAESQLVKAAREAAEAAEREASEKTKELDDQRADLSRDYGPSDVLRALRGRSISIDSGEYTYELNWLGNTLQKSKKGHGDTSMGEFTALEREVVDEQERDDGKSLGRGPTSSSPPLLPTISAANAPP
ncbi:hypothetical protein GQ602_001649 [Ophiocordyceps camponoti-floridani]|uniref:Glucosidase 2 subunit beta n=1 Tax=Ophiocordyceps camponoti-floridani TaxID=2030778 RepID=A0A8H4Q8W3_9HYPO|nr:hypothetical protein GQ602_001649 [Ophiocordyceps camponoti-floridani]